MRFLLILSAVAIGHAYFVPEVAYPGVGTDTADSGFAFPELDAIDDISNVIGSLEGSGDAGMPDLSKIPKEIVGESLEWNK